MVRNVIELKVSYDHPKCPAAAILWHKFLQIKVAYWSVMARNAIETLRIDLKWEKCDKSYFRLSKIAAACHFVKKGRWEPICGFVIRVMSLIPAMNRSRINSGVHWSQYSHFPPCWRHLVCQPNVFSLGTLNLIKLHSFLHHILCSRIIVFQFFYILGRVILVVSSPRWYGVLTLTWSLLSKHISVLLIPWLVHGINCSVSLQ